MGGNFIPAAFSLFTAGWPCAMLLGLFLARLAILAARDFYGSAVGKGEAEPQFIEPTVRKNLADTAYWNASLTTDKNGVAEISLTMPENLTAWKVKVWAMGHGTKVGQGETIVTTKKDLLVRLQAPRFFTQKDEVVLSANVHNHVWIFVKLQRRLSVRDRFH